MLIYLCYNMLEVINIEIEHLGNNIKKYRINKNYSIKQLSEKIDVSASLLSQIESGKANPSLNTLRLISEELEVPLFSFFTEEIKNPALIVKKNQRIRIQNGNTDSSNCQPSYDLLSPDMKGDIQLCEMRLEANQINSETLHYHNGEEMAVCTEGTIKLILEENSHILELGDSVRLKKGTLHRWENPTDQRCAIIFAITPPIF